MAFIMLATFLPGSQPFLLNEFLNVPESQQGVVSGNLNFAAEIVIILVIGVFGAMSDRVGRRVVMAFGFAVMGLAFYLYPQATTITELLVYRLIYAVGVAAVTVMTVTIVADYVQDESRGKATGFLGVMNGLGAMVAAFILIKLPEKFVDGGMSTGRCGYTNVHDRRRSRGDDGRAYVARPEEKGTGGQGRRPAGTRQDVDRGLFGG